MESDIKTLRPYQQQDIDKIYQEWSKGLRSVLCVAFTGYGKTFLIATIALQNVSSRKIVIAVETRRLVTNLHDEFVELGINHSVIMAGKEHLYNEDSPIQICSIDTMDSRELYPFRDESTMLILDEAHLSKSPKWQKFLDAYNDSLVLGLTATPFNGLSHFDCWVQSITPRELMEQGYLVPYLYIAPPVRIDLSKIRTIDGDYSKGAVDKQTRKIQGDIVSTWKEFGENRPSLYFCPNVKTSKEVAQLFNDAGIPAIHIDADCSDEERDQAENDLKNGKIKIVINVKLWTTGISINEVALIGDLSPTQLLNKWTQIVGRGTRTGGGFSDCVLIDHAGNLERFGEFYDDREISLGSPTKLIKGEIEKMQQCSECFRAFTPGPSACPYCGESRSIKVPRMLHVDNKMYYLTDEDFLLLKRKRWIDRLNQSRWKLRTLPFASKWTKERKDLWMWQQQAKVFNTALVLRSKSCPDWIKKELTKEKEESKEYKKGEVLKFL